nr:hypothetical protein [Tanacetum cinerariifolium]
MAPKRTAVTTTTPVIDSQLKALIAQGIANALAVRDVDISRNGDDSHDSGTGLENKSWPLIPFCVILDHDLNHPITSKLLRLTLYWIEGLVEVEEKSFPLDKGGRVNM